VSTIAEQSFEVRPSGAPIGAELLGLDLARPLDAATFAAVNAAFERHSVVVFRDQRLTPEQQIAFSRRFGPLQVNVRSEFNKPGHPEIFIVSNVENDGKPIGSRDAGRYWHSDLCYLPQPSKASLLYALEVPTRADGTVLGDTLFAGVAAAYDALPDALKRRLDGLTAANGYNYMYQRKAHEFGLRPALSDAERAPSTRATRSTPWSAPIRRPDARVCSYAKATPTASSTWPRPRAARCSTSCSRTSSNPSTSTATDGASAMF
jgi:taurine dioxygenase